MKKQILIYIVLLFNFVNLYSQTDNPCSSFINDGVIWSIDYDGDTSFLIRGKGLDSLIRRPQNLVDSWNRNSSIKIQLTKVTSKAIFVSVIESQKLTQQLGSTGALNMLASIVYTLTELPKYKYVYIDFEMGDHANPGIYSRKDFEDYFRICY